jgi:hypothetical protein
MSMQSSTSECLHNSELQRPHSSPPERLHNSELQHLYISEPERLHNSELQRLYGRNSKHISVTIEELLGDGVFHVVRAEIL